MKYKKIMIALAATAALSAAGCGSSSKDTVEVTPTPVPTAAPTSTPATASPLPTSTPAPKLIGVKTSTAKFVYLSNSTKGEVREIYLRAAGGSDGECEADDRQRICISDLYESQREEREEHTGKCGNG